MLKNIRIISKVRFTIFLVVLMLIGSSIVGLISGSGIANSLSTNQYYFVEIESGDTIWDIAESYRPDDMDVRKVVFDICKVNDIEADDVQDGMNIIVPVYS